jgi:GR25 family glycosyltransferase involved in LPS biosynthesis
MEYLDGFNNFDVVYFINLEHRKDRLLHIYEELMKTNINPDKVIRIDAIYNKDFGIVGCGKSHCLALEKFIESGKDTCVIFEDDFEFTQPQDVINDLINKVFNNVKDFDVLMLSSNTQSEQPTEHSFITKMIDCQAPSGYAVSKSFAPIFLQNNKESLKILEPIGHTVHDYCFDIYMKRLQPNSNWYCLNPKIGKQMASYSDIENKTVDYGV